MFFVDTSILLKLGASTILGLVIGLERELQKKPLGLKTSLVICVSSCILTIVSIEASNHYAVPYQKPMDPLRLAAQIVSGIGFLGAGVILHKQNDVIIGLTTAAMIWAASGLGIAAGAGFYLEAFVAVFLIIVSVELLPPIIKRIGPKSLREQEIKLELTLSKEDNRVLEVMEALKERHIKIKYIKIRDVSASSERGETHQVNLIVHVDGERYNADIYHEIKQIPYIVSVQIETLL
ncbi:hypothetical protein BEP19_13665 [Ammoniphilus oxalaticus]|uniref:MgtC/SapB/SrpB/YhiD N-terminal domain-containing protein n=1 Tax=Ammoniphilus oxalaticus TaxID=66863 RepID=A0A419SEW3_9BACL|nr:MgtC/SapB family protein [Ammoniphilus oxalaticus]RKD21680.1 hypothetical protein BEP19_13665 [Ammoniphilus oxalaticus]